jgi:hypothetical protein
VDRREDQLVRCRGDSGDRHRNEFGLEWIVHCQYFGRESAD